jgi:hypothetical protein
MILSDSAIKILFDTKSNKSKKRDQNKINEYVEALAGIPDYNLAQKTSICRWFKRITDPNTSKKVLEQAAAESGVDSNCSRPDLEKRLLLVPGLYALYI